MHSTDGLYRRGVCIVLRSPATGKVLVFHRKDFSVIAGKDCWQFPQGGIQDDRPIVEEACRELREEIGTDRIDVVTITDRWHSYDFPDSVAKNRYIGQTHRWILADFSGSEELINFDHSPAEFDAWKWVAVTDVLDLIVDFKRDAYRSALMQLDLISSDQIV